MNYTQRLLFLLVTSVIILPLYLVLLPRVLPRVLPNAPVPAVFLLPLVVITIGGSIYLARGRKSDGKKAGYARSVPMAILIAFLAPWLVLFLMSFFGILWSR